MKRLRTLLVLVVLAGIGLAGFGWFQASQPYRGYAGEVLVEIPRGMPTGTIANRLAKEGVIQSPWLFYVARVLRPGLKPQAGEYRFTKAETPFSVLERLTKGEIASYDVVVPEGHNVWDIAAVVARFGYIREQDFLKVALAPGLIRDLDPKAESLEGFLFPSTYRLTRHTTAEQFCRLMTDQFRRQWKAIEGSDKADIHEIVTMASLIEKESGVPEERPLVSSVYWNRLRKGMRMECDPTTIYAAMLRGRWRGTIYKSDLESDHPYNTYRHKGLPPGPIANPGAASLAAAIHPAESKFIYFVAKGDGTGSHNFAVDFSAHQKNVTSYRRNRDGQ